MRDTYNKKWILDHKEERKLYFQNKIKTDVNFRIIKILRSRTRSAMKNNQKCGHIIELIMCSIDELKTYLENKFSPGMNWDNWGNGTNKWNIDHIIPCSFFDMSDPVEQHMCFRWQNLQPLWWEDNMKKNDNITINL